MEIKKTSEKENQDQKRKEQKRIKIKNKKKPSSSRRNGLSRRRGNRHGRRSKEEALKPVEWFAADINSPFNRHGRSHRVQRNCVVAFVSSPASRSPSPYTFRIACDEPD